MKERNIFFVNTFILLCFCYAFSRWLPYYSFNFSEGIYIPSTGRYGFTTVLSNDVGFTVKIKEEHNSFFYYRLNYEGPGFKRQEGEKFEQRTIGHILVLQHNYQYKNFLFKTKFNYLYDFWRTGTNEAWGFGLYDNEVIGISEELEFKVNNELNIKTKFGYNFVKFPNYTSIIEEYLFGSEETAAGKQDNNMFIINLNCKYKLHNFTLNTIIQNYIEQKVLTQSGVFSNEKQKDTTLEFSYYPDKIKISNFIFFSPDLTIKHKDSNQSFLYIKSYDVFVSTPEVVENYFDYVKFSFSLPFDFRIKKTKTLSFVPEFELTSYLSRSPRDENNNFISNKKQQNQKVIASLVYNSYSQNERSVFSIFYSYFYQTSNMKFEKYYPYNYSGHYFGIKVSYTY
ncbi:MAG: hypothetical protein ABDH23_02385 [Endomicrobiia bacterium]